jgi:hypothetical protein
MIFEIFSAKKIVAFLTQNTAKFCKHWIITLVIKIKFGRKLVIIAENCDHNIDPRFTLCHHLIHDTVDGCNKKVAKNL